MLLIFPLNQTFYNIDRYKNRFQLFVCNSFSLFIQVSNNSVPIERASPSASFASEITEDGDDHETDSPSPSDLNNKATSSTNTIITTNSLLKRYASQSRTNVLRSTTLSPLIIRKQRQTSIVSTNILQRPALPTPGNSSDVKVHRIAEKKINLPPASQNTDRPNQLSRLTTRGMNTQSQLVTYAKVTQTRKQPYSMTPSIGRSTSFNTSKARIEFLKIKFKKQFSFFLFRNH